MLDSNVGGGTRGAGKGCSGADLLQELLAGAALRGACVHLLRPLLAWLAPA